MNLWDLIDRIGERRAANPRPQRDVRQFVGLLFLAGYYVMVYRFSMGAVPIANLGLIRDAMLTLGPPVGIIVGAMFRSDMKDEQTARNNGDALRTIREVAAGNQAPAGPVSERDTG